MEYKEYNGALPEGWIWTTIGEIGIVSSGGTPDRGNYNYFQGNIPWVKSGELNQGVIYKTEEKISEEGLINSSAKILPPKTLLIALYGATVGKLAILGIQATTNQAVASIVSPIIDTRFLLYFFTKNREKLLSKRKGGAQPNISQKVIKEFPLPLPPLEEQHRIVARIEELFSELDHAVEELRKAQKKLEIYKQALLKSAFEGKLTEKWREENPAQKWEIAKVGDYSLLIGSGSTPKGGKSIYSRQGIPFIRSLNVRTNQFSWEDIVYISEYIHEGKPRTQIKPKDVLLNITGASIGRCAYVPENLKEGNVNQHVCIIRLKEEEVIYNYLTFYLNSPEAQIIINRINSGATREALTLEQIKNFTFPLCGLDEQNLIVQELESRFTLIDELELAIVSGLSKTNVFRQSILKKAFEGRLQPQFSHEGKAMELIERIQIEKEKYFLEQKTAEKQKQRKVMPMETNKSILEILQEISNPITPKELWLKSKHKDCIEDFYIELKEISNMINESKNLVFTESLISLKNEN